MARPTQPTALELVAATRSQARVDAGRAVAAEYDREHAAAAIRAARVVSTARPGAAGEHARYDPAGRLLREWYLQVRAAAFTNGMGRPTKIPGAAAVEDLTAQVHRLRPTAQPAAALRAVVVLWRAGRVDANTAVQTAQQRLVDQAPYRAARDAGRAGVNATRTGILRHWYQRCFLAAVDAELGVLAPIQAVTEAEARQVAEAVDTQQHRRLIGADGVPLVTAHGTVMSEVDRRLAGGEAGVVASPVAVADQLLRNYTLEHRVLSAWTGRPASRLRWVKAAGVDPAVVDGGWLDLTTGDQSRLIGAWLDDHTGTRLRPFGADTWIERAIITPPEPAQYDPTQYFIPSTGGGDAEPAAATMFNHTEHPPAIRALSAMSSAPGEARPAAALGLEPGQDGSRRRPHHQVPREPGLDR